MLRSTVVCYKSQVEKVFCRRSLYGARQASGVYSRASRSWHGDTHRREERSVLRREAPCFERSAHHPLSPYWIAGTQISLSDQHTISVECRASVKYGSHSPVQYRKDDPYISTPLAFKKGPLMSALFI